MQYVLISIIIVILAISQNLFAQQEQLKTSYIVGVQSADSSPLYNFNKSHEFGGSLKQKLDLFAAKNHINFIYKLYNKKDALKALINGEIDFRFPDNPFWSSAVKKNHNILYSNPITYYIEGLFVTRHSEIYNPDDIKTLGVVGGILPWPLHHYTETRKMTLVKSNNCKLLIKKLIDRDIDAAYCNYEVGNYYIKQFNLANDIIFSHNLPMISDYYYLSTIKHQNIIKLFNKFLEQKH